MRVYCILFLIVSFVQLISSQSQKVRFEITTNDSTFYTVYLKEKGWGIRDSLVTRDSGSFVLPSSDFPFFSISIKDKPRAFKSFLAEENDTPISIRIDSTFNESRIFIDAGFRTNAFYAGNRSYIIARSNYVGEIEAAPRYDWEVDDIHRKRQLGLVEILEYYLKHDPVVGLAILYEERLLLRNPRFTMDNIDRVRSVVDQLCIGALSEHPAILEIYKMLKSFVEVSLGSDLLDFELPVSSVDKISTEDYRGVFLLIDFWATWCAPCIKKNEEIKKVYNRLRIQNIELLGVLMDYNTLPYNEKFFSQPLESRYAYPWNSGILFKDDFGDQVIRFYQAYEIPRTILISPLGTIIATDLNSIEEIEEAVNTYQKEMDNVPLKSIGDRN